MPIINVRELLQDARENKYAIGAYNIENIDMALAVIEAAEILKIPAIIQTTYTTVSQGRASAYAGMINNIAKHSRAEIALHLDHGNNYDICVKAMDRGYTSVMIDGSAYPLYQNIAITKRVVDYARKYDIPIEGELGSIGGVEDKVVNEISYTDVNECIEFVDRTDVDFLAIGVGTAHGFYEGAPNINMTRIQEIRNAIKTPLVLHGASGLSDDVLTDCINNGISKINFATEMRLAYTNGIREVLQDKNVYDPKDYQAIARDRVREFVKNKMLLLKR